jgi:hypothetical protein
LPNAVIVHGEVTNGSGKVIGHAWIINGVDVIDPTTGVITTKEKYYDFDYLPDDESCDDIISDDTPFDDIIDLTGPLDI